MKALIFKNKVVETDPVGFPVHKDMEWVDCPKGCAKGWLYEGGQFIPPPEPPPLTYQQKRRNDYPEIGDQLDVIMKWLATETEFKVPEELKSLAMKCMSVKAKYPKDK